MPQPIDETHDPTLESWLDSANDPETDFPIQNLPLLAYSASGSDSHARLGVAIGADLLDLALLESAGLLHTPGCHAPTVELLAAGDRRALRELRRSLSRLLRRDTATLRDNAPLRQRALHPLDAVELRRPAAFRNYTDFYASIHHATTVGSMFRPDNPLLPNYKWLPIGYHGRASSIVPSGAAVRRPCGQSKADDAAVPRFGPSRMLDYELELGCVIFQGNHIGSPIPIASAEDHILGVCLVNDWSARDLQKWEYQPLGPFLAKNFATSVSPFVVTLDALAPFRIPAYNRPESDPQPLPHLLDERDQRGGGIDLTLEVHLASAEMRRRNMPPIRISRGSFRDMYWTLAQLVAHHSSGGCNLEPGDLLASGTISGPTPDSRGCLLELTWDPPPPAGKPRRPIELPTGEKRLFLEDGDEVILRGFCQRAGFRGIGLGECRGVIAPASV